MGRGVKERRVQTANCKLQSRGSETQKERNKEKVTSPENKSRSAQSSHTCALACLHHPHVSASIPPPPPPPPPASSITQIFRLNYSFNLSLSPTVRSTMADRHSGSGQTQQHQRTPRPTPGSAFLRRLHDHAPNSTQLVGFLTLIVSGCILLFLTGLTITATVVGLIFFTPLILISSPIWVPAGTIFFFSVAGFLSLCGFGMAVLAGLSWIYKYFRGWNPPGSGRFDYARSRIADTASHMKDYAREYGGYLQSKVKDAAPGA